DLDQGTAGQRDWRVLLSGLNSKEAFSEFWSSVAGAVEEFFSGLPSTGMTQQIFFEKLEEYLTVTAYIREETQNNEGVPTYEGVYKEFFGNNPSGFEEMLKAFHTKIMAQDGSFIPSHHFNEWVEYVTNSYMSAQDISLDPNARQDLSIVMRILVLLSKMVDTLQRVSAAQANRINFYGQWQRAYTELLSHVPSLNRFKLRNWHASMITNFQGKISWYQQTVRAYRDQVKDEAKTMQTSLNQSTEASNQQANIATGILQQLSTILSQIFR
ncbi:MAG: hypothetical protein ACE5GN_07800, partial [Waddliaceae bacterium]